MKTFKILIMEDDDILSGTIAEILRDENFSVDTAEDGLAGLERMKTGSYSMVLMDLKMPHASGYDVFKRIKADYPSVKIIVMTGSPVAINGVFDGDGLSSERNGDGDLFLKSADAILQKPFDIDKLLACIRKLA